MFFSFGKFRKRGAILGEETTAVAVLNEQVISLRARVDAMEISIDSKFGKIEDKLDEAIKGASGRPSWGVVMALTGLMTLCTGLTVFILTRGV